MEKTAFATTTNNTKNLYIKLEKYFIKIHSDKITTKMIFACCRKTTYPLKPLLIKVQKIGPGGIRTHDQGIMSPLRYRCATGPSFNVAWNNLFYFQ